MHYVCLHASAAAQPSPFPGPAYLAYIVPWQQFPFPEVQSSFF